MVRPLGTKILSIEQIVTIIKLTSDGLDRPEIAKEVGVSIKTIYNYQKEFCTL